MASLLPSGFENLNVKSFQSTLNACEVKNLVKGSRFDLACRLSTGSIVTKSKSFTAFCCRKLLTNVFTILSIHVALSLQPISTTSDLAWPKSAKATRYIREAIFVTNSVCITNTCTNVTNPFVGHNHSTCIGGLFDNGSFSDPSMIFILRHAALVFLERVRNYFLFIRLHLA